jgi:uncharacterized protein (TIGR00255 family)
MNIRSMTGFARVRRQIQELEAVISVKTVNHRGLDIHFHVSSDLDPFENALRAAVKRHLTRGHVDVRIALVQAGEVNGFAVNTGRLDAYLKAFREAALRHDLDGTPDLNAAFSIPGILADAGNLELPPDFEVPLVEGLEAALQELDNFRSREGRELAAVMLQHSLNIQDAAGRMERLRSGALPALQQRLRDRLSELLRGVAIDPQRLAQEAALLADRGDIGEEMARLKIHARQVDEILESGKEVGKKLDFLLQEMNRETNTILSKTTGIGDAGLGITDLALAAKSDIEKIREQALNLE